MPRLTPSERHLRAKIAAHISWATTTDRIARTEPGRQGMLRKFANQVDPEQRLPEPERMKRAENLRKAHMQRLAFQSAKARRLRKETGGSNDA